MADDVPIIGSIGVSVVPNAKEFWARFKEQSQAGADEAGRQAGKRVSDGIASQGDDAAREYRRRFEAQMHALRVRVDLDTAAAEAQLAAFRAKAAAAASGGRAGSAADAGGGFGALVTGAILLGPALVPIAAAAGAIGSAFVGAGAAGFAALKGIQTETAANTALGKQYAGQLGEIKTGLAGIEQEAAKAAAGGLTQVTAVLDKAAPQLRSEIGQLAGSTSDIVSHLVGGLANGLQTFEPLMQHVLDYADRAAAAFESWSTGPGGAKFAAALSRDFDEVVPVLGQVAELVGHVVAGVGPLGSTSLQAINVFSEALNALPIPVLTALVDGFVALTAAAKVSAVLNTASTALRGFAAAETEAAVAGGSGVRGALGIGLARVAPAVAAYAALAIGATTAANATEGLRDSQDHLSHALGQTAKTAADLFTGHFNRLGGDFADTSHKQNLASQAEINDLSPAAVAKRIADLQTASGQIEALFTRQAAAAVGGTGSRLGGGFEASAAASTANQLADNASKIAYFQSQLKAMAVIAAQYGEALERVNKVNQDYVTHQIKAGPIDQATQAFAGMDKTLNDSITAEKTWTDVGKEKTVTLDGVVYSQKAYNAAMAQAGQDTQVAIGILQGHTDALSIDQQALAESQRQQTFLNDAVGAAEGRYKLTGQQVSLYAQAVGITADKVASGAINTGQFADAIGLVSTALSNGNTAVQGWLAAITQFSSVEDTAASRGALLGAALKTANGDLLAYSGAVAGATSANFSLVDAFQQQAATMAQQAAAADKASLSQANAQNSADQANARVTASEAKLAATRANHKTTATQLAAAEAAVGSARTAAANAANSLASANLTGSGSLALQFKDTELAAINLKTGLIDLSAKGAGPLIGQLQQIQTAAENAASATYQHELKTRGATKASDDAYQVYVSQTRGALVDEATQLGLTAAQAQTFADQYFGLKNAGDIKKQIELIGQDKIGDALKGILDDLDIISGKAKLKLEMDTTNAEDAVTNYDAFLWKHLGIKPGGQHVDSSTFSAAGNIFDNGRAVKFAGGGENHVAQFGGGSKRVWNEPETMGEAYLPLANDWRRPRAEMLLADVASRFGGTYSRGPQSSRTLVYSPTNNYVNVAPPPEPTASEMNRLANRLN